MTQLIPSDKHEPVDGRVIKRKEAAFMDGSIPSWLSTFGTVSPTAKDASNNGGFLKLDPGNTSSGDNSRIETSFGMVPGDFDAIVVSGRFEVTTTSNSDVEFTLELMDSANNNGLIYSALHSGSNIDDAFVVEYGGSRSSSDARVIDDTLSHDFKLVWSINDETARLYLDGMQGAIEKDASNLPTSSSYFFKGRCIYKGGSAAHLRLYNVSLAYYKQGQ